MKSELTKIENDLILKLKQRVDIINNVFSQIYDNKEKEREYKFNEMSELSIKSNIKKDENEDLTLSLLNLEDESIKCQICSQEPIIGIRYKCSVCSNYYLCEKCEEENSVNETHPHYFIKIRKGVKNNEAFPDKNNNINNNISNNINNNLNNDNNIIINKNNNNINDNIINDKINDEKEENVKKIYSYECINIVSLLIYIYKGTTEGKTKIILKNNGKESWPINKTKLIFDKDSDIKSEDIILNPQKPDETNTYDIIFKQIENYPVAEYKSYLWFNVDGQNFGDKIIITFKIIEKNNELEENMDKIKEFIENYGLTEGEYSNEKILEHLKQNNFDFEKTFNSLFD